MIISSLRPGCVMCYMTGINAQILTTQSTRGPVITLVDGEVLDFGPQAAKIPKREALEVAEEIREEDDRVLRIQTASPQTHRNHQGR